MSTVQPTKSGKGGKKATKAKKGSGKAKGKVAKTKQEEPQIVSSFLELEDDNFEVKVAQVPPPTTTSKKRKSDETSTAKAGLMDSQDKAGDEEHQPPPKKKRATKTSSSVAPIQELPMSTSRNEDEVDTHMTDAEEIAPPSVPASKKKGKGSRKRAFSTTRKVSIASTASKASLRAGLPDKEIDAALEAELNRPLTDEEGDVEPLEIQQPKGRRLTRTRPGSKNATASVAPTRRGTRASTATVEDTSTAELYPSMPNASDNEHEFVAEKSTEAIPTEETVDPSSKTKGTKAKGSRKASARKPNRKQDIAPPEESTVAVDEKMERQDVVEEKPQQTRNRQTSRQLPTRNTRASVTSVTHDVMDLASAVNSSVLDTQAAQDNSGHESDASVVKHGRAKRGSRKASTAVKTAKGGKKGVAASRNIEDIVQPIPDSRDPEETEHQPNVMAVDDEAINVEPEVKEIETPKKQPEATKAATKATKAKKPASKSKAATRKASTTLSHDELAGVAEDTALPQLPSARSTLTLALSPQSSDAENQPPSSRPSAQRPPLSLQSPSKSQMARVPLALATPTASPSKGTFSKLQTTIPWTAVDLEQIFQGTPTADKENNPFVFGQRTAESRSALTSPEKKLNVEQWIQLNAQRGEEKLRNECERLVGRFEGEGMRALKALEGIVCAE